MEVERDGAGLAKRRVRERESYPAAALELLRFTKSFRARDGLPTPVRRQLGALERAVRGEFGEPPAQVTARTCAPKDFPLYMTPTGVTILVVEQRRRNDTTTIIPDLIQQAGRSGHYLSQRYITAWEDREHQLQAKARAVSFIRREPGLVDWSPSTDLKKINAAKRIFQHAQQVLRGSLTPANTASPDTTVDEALEAICVAVVIAPRSQAAVPARLFEVLSANGYVDVTPVQAAEIVWEGAQIRVYRGQTFVK